MPREQRRRRRARGRRGPGRGREREPKTFSLVDMVDRQIATVLKRGQRFNKFDQLRQRHFWSSYFFPYGASEDGSPGIIDAGTYDVFKVQPSQTGQGYPTNTPLTLRETNWRNSGRVPDNQNLVIHEVGVTVVRPPAILMSGGKAVNPPPNSLWANLTQQKQDTINPARSITTEDAARVLYGTVLEMGYLTNNVPLGLCADFSQSAGLHSFSQGINQLYPTENDWVDDGLSDVSISGDPVNGVPAAAFRRKFEIPILLQHGETMGMRFNIHKPITMLGSSLPSGEDQGGAGWLELRVDWWATESFVEYS